MNDVPGWIRLLYKRHAAEYALHTAFLLEHIRGLIAEEADAQQTVANSYVELQCANSNRMINKPWLGRSSASVSLGCRRICLRWSVSSLMIPT